MDEELEVSHDLDDVIEQFMKSGKELNVDDTDPDNVVEVNESDEDDVEEDDVVTEDDDGEATEEEDDGDDAEEAEPKVQADDEAEVTVTVDGKEHKIAVKDLKRLYGQEASLTQKSQSVSAQNRAVETQGLYLAKILQSRYESAQANVAKYAQVDLFKANRDLEPDEFDALRGAKEAAEAEFAVIETEARDFMKNAQDSRAAFVKEKAKLALKEIVKAIPEWNDTLYGEIRTYAIGQGMDRDTVNEVVDAGAITMMHKAMQYDLAKTKSETVVKKVVKAPKKVLKKSASATDAQSSKLKQAHRQAVESGDIDDVAAAFLARSQS